MRSSFCSWIESLNDCGWSSVIVVSVIDSCCITVTMGTTCPIGLTQGVSDTIDTRFKSIPLDAGPEPQDRLNPASQNEASPCSTGAAENGPKLPDRALVVGDCISGARGAVRGVAGPETDPEAMSKDPLVDADERVVDIFLGIVKC